MKKYLSLAFLLWTFLLSSYAGGQIIPDQGRPGSPKGPGYPPPPGHLPDGGGTILDDIIMYSIIILILLSVLGGVFVFIVFAIDNIKERLRRRKLRKLGIPTHKDIFSHKG